MADLFLIYDTDKQSFVGATLRGRTLMGVTEVTLGPGKASVRDYNGRELLGPAPAPEQPPAAAKAAEDIAKFLGFTEGDKDDNGGQEGRA
jgi:hypothetical protein